MIYVQRAQNTHKQVNPEPCKTLAPPPLGERACARATGLVCGDSWASEREARSVSEHTRHRHRRSASRSFGPLETSRFSRRRTFRNAIIIDHDFQRSHSLVSWFEHAPSGTSIIIITTLLEHLSSSSSTLPEHLSSSSTLPGTRSSTMTSVLPTDVFFQPASPPWRGRAPRRPCACAAAPPRRPGSPSASGRA